ncbi:MAG: hypothetical protein BIFFINMI_00890 [Phycisphaerae bacterium]|nr:hypothetical protein [Phycisphaerae bacterium]
MLVGSGPLLAADIDELTVKPEQVFEFTEKPAVTRDGDRFTITFASKGHCDATVAIEDSGGKILRHLASGVLGPKAPSPFQQDSLRQEIVWDGKNDQGAYVCDQNGLGVRVSLGLKARLERTLYWSPCKRAAQTVGRTFAGAVGGVAIQAAPEGVYVFDGGQAADHVRLFDHAGKYLRTIYPFSADSLPKVQGLMRHQFPGDSRQLPIKPSYQMCTLLTSGDNALNIIFKDDRYFLGPMDPAHKGEHGRATTDIAVAGGRIALAAHRLNRLSTDGASGGLEVYGPRVDSRSPKGFYKATESSLSLLRGGYDLLTNLRPHRFALSLDGKTLYLTRYLQNFGITGYGAYNYWQHGVYRMDFEGQKEPELFLGAAELGQDARHFDMPSDVACDARGRVYVADCGNHRVQVFEPNGTLFKSIPVEAPAQLAVSPKTGELYVFSWEMRPFSTRERMKVKRPYTLRKFRSAEDPTLLAAWDLPMTDTDEKYDQCADIDFWADPQGVPTVWLNPGRLPLESQTPSDRAQPRDILVLALKDGGLELIRDFRAETEKAVVRSQAPGNNRQRLSFDPRREVLYIGEDGFYFKDAVAIKLSDGKCRPVNLPFDAEDMCFDIEGNAYLRSHNLVARYEPDSWREVPWDYGEEREHVTYNSNSNRREAKVVSGLALPVNSGWHHGGMHVSPKGSLAVGCLYLYGPKERGPLGQQPLPEGRPYTPKLYPGRIVNSVYGCEYVHVWDKYGRTAYEDAIPGLGTLNGVGIDNEDGLYVLSAAPRNYGDKPPFNFLAGTLMKFAPGKGKIVSDSDRCPIRLPADDKPKRSPDLTLLPGHAWVEGAQWFYGGVGWHGKNHGLGCGCRNTRFALDYFGRSFAPEVDRYSVAVVDTAGNLILRIGRCGNVDDGVPLIAEGGPAGTRAIGGDEVALMHGAYVATQTDRRVFVADIGNYRVVSILLGYHAEERVALKNN